MNTRTTNINTTNTSTSNTKPAFRASTLRATDTTFLVFLLWVGITPALVAQDAPISDTPTEDASQGEDVRVVLSGQGRPQLRLAFPAATMEPSLQGDLIHAGRDVEQTLRDDLEATGIFQIQGPTELAVLTLSGSRDEDFEQYRSLGNELVLLGRVKYEGDKVVLEGRIYDLPSRQLVLGKRYRGLVSQTRRIAHTFADEVVRTFTGRPGIALTSIAFHSDRDGFQEIYLMDYDGRNQRRITGHKSTSGYAEWSPAGDAIAYISYWSGVPAVYFVDLASGGKSTVYNSGTLNISPSFSPDGKRIAFAHSADSNVDIYVCERVCREPKRLTRGHSIDTNPAWSPSGTQLAFTSDRSGRPNVYIMDADGANVRRVSFEGSYNDGASWRPDGTHLAYASRRSGNRFQIAVTELVNLTTRLLTNGANSHEEPSYSPDGKRLAFTIKRGKDSQVHVMDAEEGGNWRQLTHEGNNFGPDWSPYTP